MLVSGRRLATRAGERPWARGSEASASTVKAAGRSEGQQGRGVIDAEMAAVYKATDTPTGGLKRVCCTVLGISRGSRVSWSNELRGGGETSSVDSTLQVLGWEGG